MSSLRLRRVVHLAGDVLQLIALRFAGALGAGAAQEPLELAADLEHQQLRARIEIGDQNALARQDGDEPLARQPLQRLADRRAAEAVARRQQSARTAPRRASAAA